MAKRHGTGHNIQSDFSTVSINSSSHSDLPSFKPYSARRSKVGLGITLPQGAKPGPDSSNSPNSGDHGSESFKVSSETSLNTPTYSPVTNRFKRNEVKVDFDDEEIDSSSLMYNVPFTMGSTTSLYASSHSSKPVKTIKGAMEAAEVSMPPSPLPGNLSSDQIFFADPPNRPQLKSRSTSALISSNTFQGLSPVAQDISTFYDSSSRQMIEKDLRERSHMATGLDGRFAAASNEGLDDTKLISSEKLDQISHTRPLWLPPKDKLEDKQHERDISKVLNQSAKHAEKRKLELASFEKMRKSNWTRLEVLSNKSSWKSKHYNEAVKISLDSGIPKHLKYKIYRRLLTRNESQKSDECYADLLKEAEKIYSGTPLTSLEALLAQHPSLECKTSLRNLLMVFSLPKFEPRLGYDTLPAQMLTQFTEEETFHVVVAINRSLLTDKLVGKFNAPLSQNRTMRQKFKQYSTVEDLEFWKSSNFRTMTQLMNRNFTASVSHSDEWYPSMSCSTIYLEVVELLILARSHKVFLALILNLLVNYHFGWVEWDELVLEHSPLEIKNPFQFVNRLKKIYFKL